MALKHIKLFLYNRARFVHIKKFSKNNYVNLLKSKQISDADFHCYTRFEAGFSNVHAIYADVKCYGNDIALFNCTQCSDILFFFCRIIQT